jgi:hypothetical protein
VGALRGDLRVVGALPRHPRAALALQAPALCAACALAVCGCAGLMGWPMAGRLLETGLGASMWPGQ